jgi:hypothetical protein
VNLAVFQVVTKKTAAPSAIVTLARITPARLKVALLPSDIAGNDTAITIATREAEAIFT